MNGAISFVRVDLLSDPSPTPEQVSQLPGGGDCGPHRRSCSHGADTEVSRGRSPAGPVEQRQRGVPSACVCLGLSRALACSKLQGHSGGTLWRRGDEIQTPRDLTGSGEWGRPPGTHQEAAVLCEPKEDTAIPKGTAFTAIPFSPTGQEEGLLFCGPICFGYKLRFHTKTCIYLFKVASSVVIIMENSLQPNSSGLLAIRISYSSSFSLNC